MEATQVKPERGVSAPEKHMPQFKGPRKKRGWVKGVIVLAVVAALILFLFARCRSVGQKLLSSAYLPYTAATQDLTVSVSGTGTIEPIQSYKVTTLVSGEILEAPFEEGQTVHVTRSLKLDKQLYTPAEYKALRQLLVEWCDTNSKTLLFSVKDK